MVLAEVSMLVFIFDYMGLIVFCLLLLSVSCWHWSRSPITLSNAYLNVHRNTRYWTLVLTSDQFRREYRYSNDQFGLLRGDWQDKLMQIETAHRALPLENCVIEPNWAFPFWRVKPPGLLSAVSIVEIDSS